MARYWDQRAQQYRDDADRNIATEAGYGRQASTDYLSRAENFDASQAVNRYAQGAWGSISEGLNASLRGLAGNTRSGRFDSGFYDADKGALFTGATRQLSDAVAQQSLSAAALDQRNTEGLAAFGENARGNQYDLTGDERQQAEDTSREEDQRRRARRAGIGGAIGEVLGAGAGLFLGGPGGVAGGAKIGGSLGGAIAGG